MRGENQVTRRFPFVAPLEMTAAAGRMYSETMRRCCASVARLPGQSKWWSNTASFHRHAFGWLRTHSEHLVCPTDKGGAFELVNKANAAMLMHKQIQLHMDMQLQMHMSLHLHMHLHITQ